MQRALNSAGVYLALFFTWLSALVAFNLTLPPTRGVDMLFTPFYWVGLPLMYGAALLYGFKHRNSLPTRHAQTWRFLYLILVTLGGLLFRGISVHAMFYMVVGVHMGLGFVLSRSYTLPASLAVSCLMMAFASSRPHADIPILLTIPFFVSGFVLTLVLAQVDAFRGQAGVTTYISPRRTWLGLSSLVVIATMVLGLGLLLITPFPGPGPLNWPLDKDYLQQQGVTGQAASATAGANGGGEGPTPIGAAITVLKTSLASAQTVGDAMTALARAGQAFIGASLHAYPHWWVWLVVLLGLALVAHPDVRLWVRLRYDWLNLSFRAAYFSTPAAAPAVRQAWERLLIQRGAPRLLSQTLGQHAGAAQVTEDSRVLLRGFAQIYEQLAYGVPLKGAHSLVAIYLRAFSILASNKKKASNDL